MGQTGRLRVLATDSPSAALREALTALLPPPPGDGEEVRA